MAAKTDAGLPLGRHDLPIPCECEFFLDEEELISDCKTVYFTSLNRKIKPQDVVFLDFSIRPHLNEDLRV